MKNKELLNKKESKLLDIKYKIIRPGGNDTALVIGVQNDAIKRKQINDQLMDKYPNVEQVGFVDLDIDNLELMMAGGEFCGNATRSTAWLALNGQPGEVTIKVSGVKNKLQAGVRENGEAWAQMPIYNSPENITFDESGTAIVKMDGITQVVMENPFDSINPEQAKEFAYQKLESLGLLESVAAAGVMLLSKEDRITKIDPVVWVRDIKTLFYESACGSGTTAVGLVQAQKNGTSITTSILQPSGMNIEVVVEFDGEEFKYAVISGPIQELKPEKGLK